MSYQNDRRQNDRDSRSSWDLVARAYFYARRCIHAGILFDQMQSIHPSLLNFVCFLRFSLCPALSLWISLSLSLSLPPSLSLSLSLSLTPPSLSLFLSLPLSISLPPLPPSLSPSPARWSSRPCPPSGTEGGPSASPRV